MSRMSRWSLFWPFPAGWWPLGAEQQLLGPPDDSRILVLAAESRSVTIPAESRTVEA